VKPPGSFRLNSGSGAGKVSILRKSAQNGPHARPLQKAIYEGGVKSPKSCGCSENCQILIE
jgi:hypothetical protein